MPKRSHPSGKFWACLDDLHRQFLEQMFEPFDSLRAAARAYEVGAATLTSFCERSGFDVFVYLKSKRDRQRRAADQVSARKSEQGLVDDQLGAPKSERL